MSIEKVAPKIKIPRKMLNDLKSMTSKMIQEADRQEAEFLFPYLMKNAKPRIKKNITLKKLQDRKIKRLFNQNTQECWYEQGGVVITPSFIRDVNAIAEMFADDGI